MVKMGYKYVKLNFECKILINNIRMRLIKENPKATYYDKDIIKKAMEYYLKHTGV